MCNKRFYTAIFFHANLLYEAIFDFALIIPLSKRRRQNGVDELFYADK